MIFVYCIRPSDSARALVNKINELGTRAFRLRREYLTRRNSSGRWRIRPERGDLVVNWGSSIDPRVLADWNRRGVRVLNPQVLHNKYSQLVRLNEAGVPVPPHLIHPHQSTVVYPDTVRWLARLNNHQEANDLLAGVTHGDYY